MNFLRQALQARHFLYSAELVLGRDHTAQEAETFVRDAAHEANGIRIVSLTDLPGGNPALPPEAFVSFAKEHGLTPIVHITGKDGNRSFLEARLHMLARLSVENVLALTGDAQKEGFGGKGKPVHDLDSVLILWLIENMRNGLSYQLGSRQLQSTPFDFFAGAVVNPYKIQEPDLVMQLYKLELKIAVGARFIIPQLGFNLRKLYELKQYMEREGLDDVPIIANVYVPTATIARLMKSGEVAGCVISEELIARLEKEKKAERLERAALMVAAVHDLGFAGAHIGGFGLSHGDTIKIIERAETIGSGWRDRVDELIFPMPGEFYLLPPDQNGLSSTDGEYQTARNPARRSLVARISAFVHRHFIAEGSIGERFFSSRLRPSGSSSESSWRRGFWYRLLEISSVYRKAALGCVSCGDCIQDHLNYAGCSMRWCYKELRNGPCGGSRPDGACEARPELPCIWNLVYLSTLASGDDPKKFARTLLPPREWNLDRTNALANRFAGLDNAGRRIKLSASSMDKG
jgi:methylenetetrahydrofolate reductase (NADPH)